MKIMDTKKAAPRVGPTIGFRVNKTGRRTYTAEYKRGVVRQCSAPGVSVAGIALALNSCRVGRPDSASGHQQRKVLL
ncbi:MAG: transposase [Planctomycetia bacterium]|nr:transposase [Planctomycetia bacterium]